MAVNKKFKKCLKYLGGIIFHGLEYSIRHEVFFFSSTNSFFTTFVINIGFKIKVSVAIYSSV